MITTMNTQTDTQTDTQTSTQTSTQTIFDHTNALEEARANDIRMPIGEWEHNGYHDSDWYGIVWNDTRQKAECLELGSTRYACGYTGMPKNLAPWNDGAYARAQKWLAAQIFDVIKQAEYAVVMTPTIQALEGAKVRLLTKHTSQERDQSSCDKCGGSGKWINPNKAHDQRECFSCKGLGVIVSKEKVRTADGKISRQLLPEGTSGDVIALKTFGVFYKNGYNKPGRENTQAKVRLCDGRIVSIPCDKLRLDREPMNDDQLTARARKLAQNMNFYPLFRKGGFSMGGFNEYVAGYKGEENTEVSE